MKSADSLKSFASYLISLIMLTHPKPSSLIVVESGPITSELARRPHMIQIQVPQVHVSVTNPNWLLSDEFTGEYSTTTEEPLPFFEEMTELNISVQLGQDVHLHCRVHDLKDKTVSWVRRNGEKMELITFGKTSYSGGARYSIDLDPPNNWRLFIRNAAPSDEGGYECQVSSHPPLVLYTFLTVVVPRVEIIDSSGTPVADKFYMKGSTIELRCVASSVMRAIGYMVWLHKGRTLNHDIERGGISVKTEMTASGGDSTLYIAQATTKDAGVYTCSLAGAASASATVHVLGGEHADAMQYGGANTNSRNKMVTVLSVICLCFDFILR